MEGEQVRMWRAPGADHVLLMAGRTAHYAVDPRDEYVFGIVLEAPMVCRRGSERRLIQPGGLVAWDPSAAHAGTATEAGPWSARLMVVEAADLAALGGDEDAVFPSGVHFPEPAVSDPELARAFLRMHRALESPRSTHLERDHRLADWLGRLVERTCGRRPPRLPPRARDDRALRAACEYLAERPERNVGLEELARVAGIGKFRLVRLFGEHLGLPPHALQIAHRVRMARRLLEEGIPVADVAAATGFADQSHLNRHFRRSLGLTPHEYRLRFDRGRGCVSCLDTPIDRPHSCYCRITRTSA
jgi:AraC-like DNA-binding protein